MDVAAVVNAVAVVMRDVNVNLRGVDELAGHMARHHLDHSARLAALAQFFWSSASSSSGACFSCLSLPELVLDHGIDGLSSHSSEIHRPVSGGAHIALHGLQGSGWLPRSVVMTCRLCGRAEAEARG